MKGCLMDYLARALVFFFTIASLGTVIAIPAFVSFVVHGRGNSHVVLIEFIWLEYPVKGGGE